METQRDLSQILKNRENDWVALSPDYKRVVASGKTLSDTREKVEEKERKRVIFHKVIPGGYAPTS
jgi:hypothetical protein